jgi:DNA helicase HerA-like ATPase
MEDYEKLGVFYLGRPYNMVGKKSEEGLFLYDSKDLITHAVCVGMTGSGKTGLCISLLEEAGMDNIPAIAIDPKGDLTNLLLTFPDLKAEDFTPWVNEEDALKKGLSTSDYASKQAEMWKNGLAS